MIKLTRLNKQEFIVNAEFIEFIEETPDTVISMESGRKLVVSESAEEVVRQIVAYRQLIYAGPPQTR